MSRHSRARVSATFRRRSSRRNPRERVLTHENTTMSASWPWYESTVLHRTRGSSTTESSPRERCLQISAF